MLIPSPPDLLYLPVEDPAVAAPQEVLVPGRTPAAEEAPAAAPGPATDQAEAAAPDVAPPEAPRAESTFAAGTEPVFALPAEDSFPTRAELDAILAAHAGPPAGPDAAEREATAALLGLDPHVAADPALFAAALSGLPEPDADAMLAAWLAETEAGSRPTDRAEPAGGWMLG